MRDYEVVIVLKPDIEDEARSELIEKLEAWMIHDENESDLLKSDHWGMRTLAYPIRKYEEGYYLFYDAKLDPSKINEMERNFTYQDEILRHLVVRASS
ncbi:MAG: 30S ribosomal protein S6 [Candidatus Promineifilaceae bacterium]